MNAICYITSTVSSKIDNKIDTFNAMTEAIRLATSSYSPEESSTIKKFASKLRHRSIPDLKGIIDLELSSAVWDICCWAIDTKLLTHRIMEMISLYTDIHIHRISIEFTENNRFTINLHNDYDDIVDSKELTYFTGIELIEEIIAFIKEQNLQVSRLLC